MQDVTPTKGSLPVSSTATPADGTEAPEQKEDGTDPKEDGEAVAVASDGEAVAVAPVVGAAGSAAAAAKLDPASPPAKTAAPISPVGGSTVKRFINKNGGAVRALRLYIASFAEGEGVGNELGHQPPCRSYRSLRVLDELTKEITEQLTLIRYKAVY